MMNEMNWGHKRTVNTCYYDSHGETWFGSHPLRVNKLPITTTSKLKRKIVGDYHPDEKKNTGIEDA